MLVIILDQHANLSLTVPHRCSAQSQHSPHRIIQHVNGTGPWGLITSVHPDPALAAAPSILPSFLAATGWRQDINHTLGTYALEMIVDLQE